MGSDMVWSLVCMIGIVVFVVGIVLGLVFYFGVLEVI